jgi:hypothetical protein
MSGKSEQTTTQSSTTAPYAAAQPDLTAILGKLGPMIGSSGLSDSATNAINSAENTLNKPNQYAGLIGDYATNLLNGGNANAQANPLADNLSTYQKFLTPFANGSMVGNNPALQAQLQQIQTDVTNNVNSQFAGAGRDLSGANQQAVARGVAQGEAPVIAGQYNQDVANQIGAANSLYNAGNTTSGLLTGLNQQGLANQGVGVGAASSAQAQQLYSPQQILALEQLRQNIPAQQLGLLAQIGIPIGGLGSQSTGTADTTKQDSGATVFGQITGGLGNLFHSDRNVKEDVEQIGALYDGTPVYRFRYIGEPRVHIGLMAQDVEKTLPQAVVEIGGTKMVDYKLATDAAASMGAL